MTNLSRNIDLACGHDEALATLHQDERTAWCPICAADVQVSKHEFPMGGAIPKPDGPPDSVPFGVGQ